MPGLPPLRTRDTAARTFLLVRHVSGSRLMNLSSRIPSSPRCPIWASVMPIGDLILHQMQSPHHLHWAGNCL